jgi:hypothetical protein
VSQFIQFTLSEEEEAEIKAGKKRPPTEIEMDSPLVTSTNEFIKNIGRHIYTKYGVEIQTLL